jgi:hypothetical protein
MRFLRERYIYFTAGVNCAIATLSFLVVIHDFHFEGVTAAGSCGAAGRSSVGPSAAGLKLRTL